MNENKLNTEIDAYLEERKAKGIKKLIISSMLFIGGAASTTLLNKDLSIIGIAINLLGFIGIIKFIESDKEFVFPRKQGKA